MGVRLRHDERSNGESAKLYADGHLEHMECPYLVLHGGHDVLTVSQARKVYDYGKSKGVDVTLRLVTEDETGAEHCQHDNPTIGQELMADWLADRFGMSSPSRLRSSIDPAVAFASVALRARRSRQAALPRRSGGRGDSRC